ncbi:hypothetical protein KMZ68_02555 [Bradyrhizobium sediminis]|uniref:Uncharacterized protein n=1 Tax=Bradyrhizobium sediminis TaxID=2840469 RepID=A0A975RT71_9BRAD|nr:hypothetical protein [Bradyrhizobium sediminis]QWG18794.1 hypothetical protein KMZ68_02555 [Bradyrhizobium sediminis]
MGYSKRVLFGDDPADDEARQRIAQSTANYLAPFTFKIPTRRKNRLKIGQYWDGAWPSIVAEAAKALNIESVQINDQRCFKSQEEADSVKALAEQNHQAWVKRYEQPSG